MSSRNNRTQTETGIIKGTYRRTGMGGFTEPLALRLIENRLAVVTPIRKGFSRSGNHGEYYYGANAVDIMLHFEITNSGHRAVFIRCLRAPQEVCNRVYDVASSLWQSGGSVSAIAKALTLLQL